LSRLDFEQPRHIYRAYPHQLSGGQRQRVVIAQVMACRPALVIADEPTSMLDASLQTEILALMREISRRHHTAFVLISHNPTVLAGFVDRIVVMYAGRIIEEGRTEDIFRRPLHPYTQALMGLTARYLPNSDPRTRFKAIEGEPPDISSTGIGCPFAPRCPDRMQVCTEREVQETTPYPSQRVSCFKYGHSFPAGLLHREITRLAGWNLAVFSAWSPNKLSPNCNGWRENPRCTWHETFSCPRTQGNHRRYRRFGLFLEPISPRFSHV
jgi:oligopeptide/dipeptide ABC transporter ATP-binding protein